MVPLPDIGQERHWAAAFWFAERQHSTPSGP